MSMRRSERGLTLAEVVIAVAVAAVALLTLVLFTSMIHRVAREGKSQAAASTLAREAVERLRTDSEYFDQALAENPLEFEREQLIGQSQQGKIAPTRFQVSVELEPMEGSGNRFFKTSVRVEWTEEHRDREVLLETYLPVPD
ncbi:MAG: prepilin-type N-terminal cleavage/methylation domain-containing protein [Armatimonadetes bacterium]|nr:prepilin-type N-terminal cleavage/methylation domain-containing protein [Armatimonadota bacterium]